MRIVNETAEGQEDYRSNLLQVICYFRSAYEVLVDADEHLSGLLGPAYLLVHLQELVRVPAGQLVPTLKYLVCWPMPVGYARRCQKRHLTSFGGRVSPLPSMTTRNHVPNQLLMSQE